MFHGFLLDQPFPRLCLECSALCHMSLLCLIEDCCWAKNTSVEPRPETGKALSWVALNKLLSLEGPQFPHPYNMMARQDELAL